MRSSYADNLRRIRLAARSARVAALPLEIRILASAVANPRAEPSACARCRLELPAYVDAELDHRLPRLVDSFSRQHLLTCENCAKDYADMLETATLFSGSRLPKPSQIPKPDLRFLKGSNG